MNEQNFKNHGRYIISWHILTGTLVIGVIVASIVNLINSLNDDLFSAILFAVISLILASIFWFARAFALRAQDRAIRAEENFRYYILTGKSFDNRLRMGQIIAIRFASNEEMPELVVRAIEEKLSQKQIKQAIRNWKADHNRV